MAIYPDAVVKLVDRYKPGGSVARTSSGMRRIIFHTAVVDADSLFGSMNTPGTPTSHFYIRADGTVEQYINTAIESSANLEGNHDCITVESEDKGPPFPDWTGSNVPPWTDAQLASIVGLIVWANHEHGIPIVQLPSSRAGSMGVGWHRQGIDGNFPTGLLAGRVSGGEVWSSSFGKPCPGDNRIKQLVNEAIPQAKAISTGDDMPSVQDILDAHVGKREGQTVDGALAAIYRVEDVVRRLSGKADADADRDQAIQAKLDDLQGQVTALEAGNATEEQVRRVKQLVRELRADLQPTQEPTS